MLSSGRWTALRRRQQGEGSAVPDAHLTFLTVAEADRVRSLVREAFAEQGREVIVAGDHVRDDQDARFGLWNVAVACRNEPRGQAAWPHVVAGHVAKALTHAGPDVFDGLAPSDVRARTYARLVPAVSLPAANWPCSARQAVPGLMEVLAVDLTEVVMMLGDDDAARFGGAAVLREAGLDNLRALPPERHEHIIARDGGHFHVLHGASMFVASRVLVMPHLLAQIFGPATARHGVLAAMPSRHRAVLHVITDETAVASIGHMAGFAVAGYNSNPGPLSPSLYWWRPGMWRQISGLDASGQPAVRVDPELRQILRHLADQ
jgi:hypothetical protein